MKKYIIIIIALISVTLEAESRVPEKLKIKSTENAWYAPDFIKTQFAGNIGFISFGPGYYWWRNNVQTDFLYGYVPESVADATIHTFTLKNTFRLYSITLFDSHVISPICGFSLSFEPGQHSYIKVPDKYPDGYYSTNAFYACLNLGLKSYTPFENKDRFSGMELYAEVNTVADYAYYNIINQEDSDPIIYTLSLGMNILF